MVIREFRLTQIIIVSGFLRCLRGQRVFSALQAITEGLQYGQDSSITFRPDAQRKKRHLRGLDSARTHNSQRYLYFVLSNSFPVLKAYLWVNLIFGSKITWSLGSDSFQSRRFSSGKAVEPISWFPILQPGQEGGRNSHLPACLCDGNVGNTIALDNFHQRLVPYFLVE